MDSLRKSYRLAGGASTLCVRVRMPHGHGGRRDPEEIRRLRRLDPQRGPSLARFTSQTLDGVNVSASFKPSTPWSRRSCSTRRTGGRGRDASGSTAAAKLDGDTAKATLPDGTAAYYMNIEDERGCVVSTRHATIAARAPNWRPGAFEVTVALPEEVPSP